jgi:uncharacterized damage-inducible protein DinB
MAFDRSQIDVLAQGAAKLRDAVKGLSPTDLQARPGPGKWSIHECIVHICDADQAFAFRIKQILAEDNPTLQGWDENKFIEKLDYHHQSLEAALQSIDGMRKQTADILRNRPDSDFDRAGTHSQRGRQTITEIVGYYVWHLDHHLKFVLDKRKTLGK